MIELQKTSYLDHTIRTEPLHGDAFTGEQGGHEFIITCYQHGERVNLTGTISGRFMRPGGSVALVGSVSNGQAIITLSSECYERNGGFLLTVFNTVGNDKFVIYACTGNVRRSSSEPLIDGGEIIDSVEDLISDIQTATAQIPVNYNASFAPAYSTTGTYAVGDYVTNNGNLYRCTAPITSGETWNSSHWKQVSLGADVANFRRDVTVNLAGASIGKFYPVYIAQGEQITVSTSDGSTFDQTVKLHYYGQNKNHLGQWAFASTYGNKRTMTVGYDVYWLTFEWQDATTYGVETDETMPIPYMVNIGSAPAAYKVWHEDPQVRALRLDVTSKQTELETELTTFEGQTNTTLSDHTGQLNTINESLSVPYYGDISYSFGGLAMNGGNTQDTNRLRFLFKNAGALWVLGGSRVTVDTGYKYNLCRYSRYDSYSDYDLIEYVSMRTTEYIVPEDCYVRIGFGATNDAVLWSNDTINDAGKTAFASVHLTLYTDTVPTIVKNGIDTIEPLIAPPPTATEYYALWNGFLSHGVAKSVWARVDGTDDYQINLYILKHDNKYIDGTGYHTADGTNKAYDRPAILIISGVHGNERTTPMCVWDFVRRLIYDKDYQEIVNAYDWYFVPLANPWGFSHSEQQISSGDIKDGSHWAITTDGVTYNALLNTSSMYQGIRRGIGGYDINRDFVVYNTIEAQTIRDIVNAIISEHNNEKILTFLDVHMGDFGSGSNSCIGQLNVEANMAQQKKNLVFRKWMETGAETEWDIAQYSGQAVTQNFFPMTADASGTTDTSVLRNYMADYCEYSILFEGCQVAYNYTKDREWSEPVARLMENAQFQRFAKSLCNIEELESKL